MKIDNIKRGLMPEKVSKTIEKLKESNSKKDSSKIDLKEFITTVARKQMEADKANQE